MLDKHFTDAFAFVKTVKERHDQDQSEQCWLVHCQAGLNRSGLIACACILMLEKTTNVLATVMNLRKQRGSYALFNESFQEQLIAFARVHQYLGPKPGDEGCVVDRKAPPPPKDYKGFLFS